MKPYAQDAREILEKAAAAKKKQTRFRRAVLSSVAAFAILLGIGVWGWQAQHNRPAAFPTPQSSAQRAESVTEPGQSEIGTSAAMGTTVPGIDRPFGTTDEAGQTDAPTVTVPLADSTTGTDVATTQGVTRQTSQPNDGSGSFGGTQNDDLPITVERLQTELGVARRNETLNEATAQQYIAENRDDILYSLSMSGVPTDGSVTISDYGYTHLNLVGGGTWKELATDFRDYLIYNDDRLIAILSLWIMDGEVHASPAFGAPWFDDYNAFLQRHRGEALAFVYVGMLEAVVTPQGEVLSPMGLDLSDRFPDSANGNYYDYVAYPENTYLVP